MKRARELFVLCGAVAFLMTAGGCKKEGSKTKTRTKVKPATPTAMGATPKSKKRAAPAAVAVQSKEEQGTVVRARSLRNSRTIITSAGARRVKMPKTYEVHVGLPDGTRVAFLHLKKKIKKGSKVTVRYKLKGKKKVDFVLKGAVGMGKKRILVRVLPSMKETAVAIGKYQISFPGTPQQKTKTGVGTLHRYDYKFDKSYSADTYYFTSLKVEGGGGKKFIKKQAAKFLAMTGGKRIAVRIGGVRKVRKSDLRMAKGRFSVEIKYFKQVGRIQLWLDKANKTLYAAWMHAYSRNRLASEKGMQRKFFRSFGPKQ